MTLPFDRVGAGPRLVLVHGFTQTRHSWGGLVDALAADHEVVTVDAPGHGEAAGIEAGLAEGGELVARAGGPGTYLGYSMGGRLCLHAALADPDAVRGLVLVSATGGIDDPDERAARRHADEALADRLEAIGLEAFLDEWLAQPLFAGLEPAAADRPARLANTTAGLASSLRLAGTGTQRPLWDELADVDVPVLVVAGEHDTKFRALGRRLADAIGPSATFEVVPGAGHTAHLEQPARFLALLGPWLADQAL